MLPQRRIPTGNDEGAFAGVRIGPVLHPAVLPTLLTLADDARFVQHRDIPTLQDRDRWPGRLPRLFNSQCGCGGLDADEIQTTPMLANQFGYDSEFASRSGHGIFALEPEKNVSRLAERPTKILAAENPQER
jgi:hypothetical protein